MVPPCSDRVSRAPPYSSLLSAPCPYGTVTLYGAPFHDASGSAGKRTGLVRFRSSLLTESRLMSFPPGNEIFQFPGFASCTYGFSTGYTLLCGFPHSDIPGSKGVSTSPGLFAAYHVLHRLSTPRHPPDALHSLTPLQQTAATGTQSSPLLAERMNCASVQSLVYLCLLSCLLAQTDQKPAAQTLNSTNITHSASNIRQQELALLSS